MTSTNIVKLIIKLSVIVVMRLSNTTISIDLYLRLMCDETALCNEAIARIQNIINNIETILT